MSTVWKIVAAAGAFIIIYFVRHVFGTVASVVAIAVLLLGWWLLHLYTERRLDGLYSQFQQLDTEQKAQALSELGPEIRRDIEKRIAKQNKC